MCMYHQFTLLETNTHTHTQKEINFRAGVEGLLGGL